MSDAWAALEPGTAHPLQRLRAVRQLRDAGVHVGVLMAPVVPGFTTHAAQLEATVKAIADHGAAFAGANVMYLKGGTKDHFHRLHRARSFRTCWRDSRSYIRGAYAPTCVHELDQGDGRRAAGAVRRADATDAQGRTVSGGSTNQTRKKAAPEQAAFDW